MFIFSLLIWFLEFQCRSYGFKVVAGCEEVYYETNWRELHSFSRCEFQQLIGKLDK